VRLRSDLTGAEGVAATLLPVFHPPTAGKEECVAAPIRIGTLDATEASDLVQALAARGLIGRPVGAVGSRWVEVNEAREETHRLLHDVTEAVAIWLAENERPTLDIEVEGRVHHVSAQADLRDALRAQLRVKARTRGRGGGGAAPPSG
jgi:hypothetical protein